MSDLRKAAEMALEALSEYTGVVTSGTDPTKWNEVVDGGGPAREAIQALRQALAQPEQEPVACIGTNGELMWLKKPSAIYNHAQPLYTAPPNREWVGLTEEEFKHFKFYAPPEIVWQIEDRLKGKNT